MRLNILIRFMRLINKETVIKIYEVNQTEMTQMIDEGYQTDCIYQVYSAN